MKVNHFVPLAVNPGPKESQQSSTSIRDSYKVAALMRTIIKGSEEESQDGNWGRTVPGFLTLELYPKEERSTQAAGAMHQEERSVLHGLSSTRKRSSFQVFENWMTEDFLQAFPAQQSKLLSLSLACKATRALLLAWVSEQSPPVQCKARCGQHSSLWCVKQVRLISSASHIPLLFCVAILPPPSFHWKPLPLLVGGNFAPKRKFAWRCFR